MYGWYSDNYSVFLEDHGVFCDSAFIRDPAFIRSFMVIAIGYNVYMAFCSFVGAIYDIESNPFIYATIAASLLAVVLLIVAVISLIILCKQRTDNKRSYLPLRHNYQSINQ